MQKLQPLRVATVVLSVAVLTTLVSVLLFPGEQPQVQQAAVEPQPTAPPPPQEAELPTPLVPEALAAEPALPPNEVKAIYATAQAIFSAKLQDRLVRLLDATELNALVVDVKDGGGVYLGEKTAQLVKRLQERNVYPIARMSVFQDGYLAKERPELALKDAGGALWASGGAYWVDPASREVWEYSARVAVQALDLGFKEINLDYIRFPSDGNLYAAVYPVYDGTVPKEQVIGEFAGYIVSRIKGAHPGAVVSADVFAQSFLSDTDVGIGQRLAVIARDFDVIAPMVYPSHYAPYNFGFQNPAEAPYAVVRGTLERGKAILDQAGLSVIVRPWLQAFDLGARYTPEMVQEQFRATEDAGNSHGWMLWNAGNVYDPDTFTPGQEP